MSETQTLSFYTLGPEWTELMKTFLGEGSYSTLYTILDEGGLQKAQIKKFFLLEGEFVGDTRAKEGMHFVELPSRPAEVDYAEYLITGIRTAVASYNNKRHRQWIADNEEEYDEAGYVPIEDIEHIDFLNHVDEIENLQALFTVFTKDEVRDLVYKKFLTGQGWEFAEVGEPTHGNGVILRNGEYIHCKYDHHKYLYPHLHALGLASDPDWVQDTYTIHVSSRQIGGAVGHAIGMPRYSEHQPTEEQLQALFKFRKEVDGGYGSFKKSTYELLEHTQETEDFGNKYNNLAFLKKFYKTVNIPLFSKEPIPGVKNCLRTSPLYSLPGLLESKFDITETSLAEMQETFEKHKDVIKDNKLNVFYQEYLEGPNGVCHCFSKDEVTYSLSATQGAIVAGKKGDRKLSSKLQAELTKLAKDFFEDLNKPLQLEFVVSVGKIFIVQLRILKNHYEQTAGIPAPENPYAVGKTFSQGVIDCVSVKDILIVDTDAPAEALLGKKALIVCQEVEFSHILALSCSLRIPSIFGTGKLDLSPKAKIKLTAYNKNGYIEIL